MRRIYEPLIARDLDKKMVFLGGPRQVGKTTLSKSLGADLIAPAAFQYLNWDVDEDRNVIINKLWHKHVKLVIFDELHKFKRWKQWIKGIYDSNIAKQEFLVTGSARLDIYKKGGDSLMGRYHYWRMHPITIDELPDAVSYSEGLDRLMKIGGFPEPFLQNDEREARRWRKERFDKILREDVRDIADVRNLSLLRLFVDALRRRVSHEVVVSNLAGDLQISPTTAQAWLILIQNMYVAFAIYPLTTNIPRAIQKPPKVFFYDNADVLDDHGARLENLVATTLLKRLQFLEDYHGYECELRYIRDKDDREVDFVTIINGEICDLIEVKSADQHISKGLRYYAERLQPKNAVQIVGNLGNGFTKDNIMVVNPIEYFTKIAPAPWIELDT
ncbi:MAG TPA: ATP-binding protein [Gammaproteobacteria bacterium]|nr:ATP-binding protein [Gammaproteobacteria bacterium]